MPEDESEFPTPRGVPKSFHPDDAKAPELPQENPKSAAEKKWICSECFDPNDACRDFCDSCKTRRPSTTASVKLPPAQPTDSCRPPEEPPKLTERWTCPKCDEPNKAGRVACNNCSEPRPQTPEPWVCLHCDEPNKAERDKCNTCGQMKGSRPSAAENKGSETIISLDSSDEESKPTRDAAAAATKPASSTASNSAAATTKPVSSSAAPAAGTAASEAPTSSLHTKKVRSSSSSSSSGSRSFSSSSSSSSGEKFIGGAAERSRRNSRSRSERRKRRIERAGRSPSNQVRRYARGAGPGLDGRPLLESTDCRAPPGHSTRDRSRSPWHHRSQDSNGWHEKSNNSWHQDWNDKRGGWDDKDWNRDDQGSGWWSSQAPEPHASQTWSADQVNQRDRWDSSDDYKQDSGAKDKGQGWDHKDWNQDDQGSSWWSSLALEPHTSQTWSADQDNQQDRRCSSNGYKQDSESKDKGVGWDHKDWNRDDQGSGWWSSQASEPHASQTWSAGQDNQQDRGGSSNDYNQHSEAKDKGGGWNHKDWNRDDQGSGWWSSQAPEPQASQAWSADQLNQQDRWVSRDDSKQEKPQRQNHDWKERQTWSEARDDWKDQRASRHDSEAKSGDQDWQGHQSWKSSQDSQKERWGSGWKLENHVWQDRDWREQSRSTGPDEQKDWSGGNDDSTAKSSDWDWQSDKSWGAGQADQPQSWGGHTDSKAVGGSDDRTEKQAGWDEWNAGELQWQDQDQSLPQSPSNAAKQNASEAAWSITVEHQQDDSSSIYDSGAMRGSDEREFKRSSGKPPLPPGKPPLPSGKPPLPRPISRKEPPSPVLDTEETFFQPAAKKKAKKILPSPLSRDLGGLKKQMTHIQLQTENHSPDDGTGTQMEHAKDGAGEGIGMRTNTKRRDWDEWSAQKRRNWDASKDKKETKGKNMHKERKERKRVIPDMPEKLDDDRWEERKKDVGLSLVKDLASMYSWTYPLYDDSRRSFAGYLRNPWTPQQCNKYFEMIRSGTEWLQPSNEKGAMPRKTAWLVAPGCECMYQYGPFEVPAKEFPPWMISLMSDVMPFCGLTNKSDWPNSCNINLYEDGGSAVGWHSDDEMLFQGKYMDILIISLSLGVTRTFELRYIWPEEGEKEVHSFKLGSGDLMTMEGMTQKHMQHRVPRWRWVVKHTPRCPAGRCSHR